MKKTAIQQIIDILDGAIKEVYIPAQPILSEKLQAPFISLKAKATELLEVEKEQIKDAYCAPYNYGITIPTDLQDSAESYYQSMYKDINLITNKQQKKYPCIICGKMLTTPHNECCDSCMFPKKKNPKK